MCWSRPLSLSCLLAALPLAGVAAEPLAEAGLRLSFAARVKGLKREERQFNNCYVGVATFDAAGMRLSMQVREPLAPEFSPGQLVVKVPASDVLLISVW